MDGQAMVQLSSQMALVVLIISATIAFIRLVLGPHAADRVAALDLFSVLIVAFLAAYAIHAGEASFLDVAIAYALVAFLGTVALCRFLHRSAGRSDKKRNEVCKR
ncbi:MAG: cation:proton antiporter [Desulfobacterales bacterium]|nr:cation:proton antiporter [Desulfobacterales bacterium]